MPTFVQEQARRVTQFAEMLRLMRRRRKTVARRDCFVVFDEAAPPRLGARRCRRKVTAAEVRSAGGTSRGSGSTAERIAWRPGQTFRAAQSPVPRSRFVQFAFRRDCFYLDLPSSTLGPHEARRLLRERRGFFRARSRPDLPWVFLNWDDVARWNMLQKVYIYRDEDSAAEDMAHLMFRIWRFPVDSAWYVKAAAFGTDLDFETGAALE